MSVKDYIKMDQGNSYEESALTGEARSGGSSTATTAANNKEEDNSSSSLFEDAGTSTNEQPSGKTGFVLDGKIKAMIAGLVAIVLIGGGLVFYFTQKSKEQEEQLPEWAIETEPEFSYTADQKATLRSYGYTADDIEEAIAFQTPFEDLVQSAENSIQAKLDSEIGPYLDSASDEFKWLRGMTWVGGEEVPTSVFSEESAPEFRYGTYNCDYEKVPAYGTQLFIKLDILDMGITAFMDVTPERYATLDDSGNIVVIVEYNKYPDGTVIITDLGEKDVYS